MDPREFREFADEFGELVRALPFQLPENFLLLVRALSLTSGVCSSLDPAFNIWDAVEPYAQRLIRDEGGTAAQEFVKQAASAAGVAARLPGRLDELTTKIEDGRIAVQTPALERRLGRLERASRRTVSAVIFVGLLIGGALLRSDDVTFGTVLMAASALPLVHALLSGRGP